MLLAGWSNGTESHVGVLFCEPEGLWRSLQLIWCAGDRYCRSFFQGVLDQECQFYCVASPLVFPCSIPVANCQSYSWFSPALVGLAGTGPGFPAVSSGPCSLEWPALRMMHPVAHVEVIVMNVLLNLPVSLLDSVADLLLDVGVGRVVLNECTEVLVFIIGSLADEHTILELLSFRRNLLSSFLITCSVPFGNPLRDRSSCVCNSSSIGSRGGAMGGSGFCDFFFLILLLGWSSHSGWSERLSSTLSSLEGLRSSSSSS